MIQTKKRTILGYKQCLNDLDVIFFRVLNVVKIFRNCRNAPSELMELYSIYSKPNNFRNVQNLYQDKSSMDRTLMNSSYYHLLAGMKENNHSPLIRQKMITKNDIV